VLRVVSCGPRGVSTDEEEGLLSSHLRKIGKLGEGVGLDRSRSAHAQPYQGRMMTCDQHWCNSRLALYDTQTTPAT
jgi:hypothetical protein